MLKIIITALLVLCTALAGAEDVRLGGTGAALGTMRLQADAFHSINSQSRVIVLQALGSGGAIKALLAGAIEVAVISRLLSADEKDHGLVAIDYASTPFILASWPGNPIDGVTVTDLGEFYAAKRTQWPDRTPVRLVLPPAGDIDTKILSGMSPVLRDAVAAAGKRPGMFLADTDTEAADLIERTEGSLGPTTLALLLSERRNAKILKLDGAAPSVKSLADGGYRLNKRLYLVLAPRAGAGARGFAAFIQSSAGRMILERNGQLPTPMR